MQPTPALQHAILAAALDPDLWPNALSEIFNASGGIKPHILHYDPDISQTARMYVAGYEDSFLQSWDSHFAALNAWAPGFLAAPEGSTLYLHEMCAIDELKRTVFYADWVKPQEDSHGGAGAVIIKQADRTLLFGGNIRARDRDKKEQDWHRFVQSIAPLLRHAIDTNRMMLGLRLDTLGAQLGAGRAGTAVVLLNRRGHVIHANPAGEAELLQGQRLRIGLSGTLLVAAAGGWQALDRIFPAPRLNQPVLLRDTTARLLPVTAEIIDLLRPGAMLTRDQPSQILLLSPPRQLADPSATLRQAFRLTEGEIDIALSLARGLTLADIAERRGVSIHTVRNQVKSALSKTETRRQADLVGLVERLRHA